MTGNDRRSENALADLRWVERVEMYVGLTEHGPLTMMRPVRPVPVLQQRWCIKTYKDHPTAPETAPQQVFMEFEWRDVPTVIEKQVSK